MLFSSCQKWVWNWFRVSINFTLCSLWEVFHLLKFKRTVLFKRCLNTTFRDPQLDKKTHVFNFAKKKSLYLLLWTLLKLVKNHRYECNFKGFLPISLRVSVWQKHASSEKPAWLVQVGTVSVLGLRRLLRNNFVSSSLFPWTVLGSDTWYAQEIQVP